MNRRFVLILSLSMLLGATYSADAAIVDLLRYELGESGSFSGLLPLDTVGSADMTTSFGITPGAITDTAAPGSTNATRFSPSAGITGSYGASSAGLPTDNFAVELWARSTNVNQPFNNLFSLNGNTTGGVTFHHGDQSGEGVWAASLFGVNWIGAAAGVGQTATDNVWTNLAIIHSNGESTFYIDGVAQSGTVVATPTAGTDPFGIHLGITPGGLTSFRGDLDEVRIFSFNPSTDDPVAALSVNQAVPEPATISMLGMLGLAVLGFYWWRRK